MSSRSLAAARARRAGENAPPVSGNRPVTSIGSQAAFAQQMPPGVGYNMPPPPSNVRTARAMQNTVAPVKPPPQQYQQFYDKQQSQQPQQSQNSLPFSKLSVSDAIGLITLRLGRVEQWIIETEHEEGSRQLGTGDITDIPTNHKVIDNSVLTSMINRLDSLEKNGPGSGTTGSSEEVKKLIEDVKTLTEQFKRMGDDVAKHTIEIAKNTEQVFRFNRELTETKDILKSFMVKYDMFAMETLQSFSDYETALSDLELRLPSEQEKSQENLGEQEGTQIGTNINDIDTTDGENIIMSVDLKNLIKQELSNIS
jgi:molybdopterin converting factor small subunit